MDNREKEFQTTEVSKNFNLDEVEIFEGEDIEYGGKIPHGWKFCPTDEELIIYYLQKRVENQKLPCNNVINEVRLYESDITDIIEIHKSSEQEGKWYFFTNRERKYRGGDRPGRSTPNGFWRATGADIEISMKNQETGKDKNIGLKKTLKFHWGKQIGKHLKSGWMMHEYRIKEFQIPKEHGTKLDDAVLCKIYWNGNGKKVSSKKNSSPSVDQQSLNQTHTTSDSAIRSLPPNQNFSPDSVLDVTNHTQSLNQNPSYMHPTPANLNPTQTPIQYVDPHSVYVPYNQYNDSTFYPQFHYDPHNSHFAYDNGGSSMQGNSTYYNMTQYQPNSTDSFVDPHQPNWNPFESEQFSLRASCCPIEAVPLNYIDPHQPSFVNNTTMPSQHDNFHGGAQQFHASSFSNMMDAPHVVQAQHLTTSLPTNHNDSLIEQFNQHNGGFEIV